MLISENDKWNVRDVVRVIDETCVRDRRHPSRLFERGLEPFGDIGEYQ